MDMDQMVWCVFLEPLLAFQLYELSKVFNIEQIDDVPLVLIPEVPVDVTTVEVVLEDVVVESGTMDLPLSFDVLSGFISRFDNVLALSSMDLSFFFSIFLPLVIMIVLHVHLAHPQHMSLILMMGFCRVIWMRVTSLILTTTSLRRGFRLLLMILRQST